MDYLVIIEKIILCVWIILNVAGTFVFERVIRVFGYRECFDEIPMWMYLFFAPAILLAIIFGYVPYRKRR
jgi:hypothetical protein